MPKKKTPSRKQNQHAPNLVDRLALKSVRIVESHSKLNIAGGVTPTEVETSATAGFGVTDEGTVLGNVTVIVATPKQVADDNDTKPADAPSSSIEILTIVQCVYALTSPLDGVTTISPDEASALNATTTFIAWPYVRAHVQAVTSSMGIPPVTLPLLRFGDSGRPKK